MVKAINLNTCLVSIVVTTRNEEKNIRNCLDSLKSQTWKNIEIILVDNHSTDRTVEIALEYTKKVYLLGPERSAQRNFGIIQKATGEFVLYVDADMILSPILIDACIKQIKELDAVALHIPEIVLGKKYFSRVRNFERSFYDGTPVDGSRFFSREIFIRSGGFDEKLFVKGSGEDWDLDKNIRQFGSIGLVPRAFEGNYLSEWPLNEFIEDRGLVFDPCYAGIYHNEAEFELIPYLKKKSYYSLGFDGYIRKWGADDNDIYCQFSLRYRLWTVFVEHKKWRRLLARPDLSVGLYFLRFSVGFIYLLKKLGLIRLKLAAQ